MQGFTVLTVNVHKGFTSLNRRFILHELRDAVRSVDADLVFLQEVLGSHAKHARRHRTRWPQVPQYEFLADSIWNDFAYGRNAVYPHGHHGNALLSKFPILRYENRDATVRDRDQRGLLHCVLDFGRSDQQLHAICAHLGLLERHRERQIDLLCSLIEHEIQSTATLIVAGDFNDWRGRAHRRLASIGMREVFEASYGHCARTFPARFPLLPLDRIYVRNLAIVQSRVLSMRPWSHLSDHTGLVARLRLPSPHPASAPGESA